MSNINDIVLTMQSDMETYINPSYGYSTTPTIRHGRYTPDQLGNNCPALCFAETGIELSESFGTTGLVYIHILIYGYARHDGYGDNNAVLTLAMDAIKFLNTDYSLTDDVIISEFIETLAGGQDMPISVFSFDVKIKMDWDNLNIND